MGYRKRQAAFLDTLPQLAGIIVLLVLVSPEAREVLRLTTMAAIVVALSAGLFFVVYSIWKSNRTHKFDASVVLDVEPPVSSTPPPVRLSASHYLARTDWFQFEKLTAALFEREGYLVERRGGARPDGGIDLVLRRDNDVTAVQCKKWDAWKVGVRQLREFLGALTDAKVGSGCFVAAADVTGEALQLARTHGIRVIGRGELIALIDAAIGEGDSRVMSILNDTSKYCPRCERLMVVHLAKRGINVGKSFWGCTGFQANPRCRHTEPVR